MWDRILAGGHPCLLHRVVIAFCECWLICQHPWKSHWFACFFLLTNWKKILLRVSIAWYWRFPGAWKGGILLVAFQGGR